LAAADHDFVLSEPVSKLQRLREKLVITGRRRFSRSARRGRRYFSIFATGFFIATAAVTLLNALVWQGTRHPAPLFARAAPVAPAREPRIAEMSAVPAPRAPAAIALLQAHDKPFEKPPVQKSQPEKPPLETSPAGPRPARVITPAKPHEPHDEISELLEAPPVPKAPRPRHIRSAEAKMKTTPTAPSKAVLRAQRALVRLGFVLNPDGVAGLTTRHAIERYERDHGLPARGELTPALMRQLSIEAGMPTP